MSDTISIALNYAERGLKIIPIKPSTRDLLQCME